MAATAELPAEERVRELTADPKLSTEEANRYGDLFAQAGKYPIALMFYERTKDRERLGRLKKDAIRTGDAFLLHGITRLVSDIVESGEMARGRRGRAARGQAPVRAGLLRKSGRRPEGRRRP